MIMKKRKSALSFALAASMALSLLGCGSGSTPSSESAKDNSKSVKELTMWYQENQAMIPAMEQRVADFNKTYEGQYHLNIEFIPRGSSYAYEDKVNSAASAGILPDLLALDGPNLSNYAANGIIIPITDYISDESKEDMLPSSLLQNTYQNQIYAVSINEAVSLFLPVFLPIPGFFDKQHETGDWNCK